jgi:hypothetical protein
MFARVLDLSRMRTTLPLADSLILCESRKRRKRASERDALGLVGTLASEQSGPNARV